MKTFKLIKNTFNAVSAVVAAYQIAKAVAPAVKKAAQAVKLIKK